MLPPRVTNMVEQLLGAKATLDSAIRAAIIARAGSIGNATPPDVPQALAAWTDKVARHAYKCTDEDIATLRAAGYSEDQIYEATVTAAVGAGIVRFRRGLEILRAKR
jgi:alkylhydroperoxidase family enzyme